MTLTSGDPDHDAVYCTRINKEFIVSRTLKKGEFDVTERDITIGDDGLLTLD